ncbi:hypothetical protein RYR30_001944 [Flavobacterium psychrophilum]|uniref:hypothetical protein n=1 Tax=Flavobacterium psychrophilum TaxID=96345 RepID=UPI000B7C3BA0|nr:hypothetical protein [Flavobacterium psychrophilum]EKT3962765.1 hypothetical protein [Flavobacterium psychrophilum]EKT4500948.1 hypothetical protein [Flavobacterium psychrophilum]EKT4508383.1 hypothetical protein [Flavobacterium psychrophilum]EKT4545826.1 hypothetical protein [Flavobacterium psychrophilum]EKT4550404.1 hypothetical protein [Flavobacterium psychrophilum]
MGGLKDIYNGWKSYLIHDPIIAEIAKERAKHCAICIDENDKPIPVRSKFEVILPDFEIKEIEGLVCSICNCPLSTATRSKDYSCPLKKW